MDRIAARKRWKYGRESAAAGRGSSRASMARVAHGVRRVCAQPEVGRRSFPISASERWAHQKPFEHFELDHLHISSTRSGHLSEHKCHVVTVKVFLSLEICRQILFILSFPVHMCERSRRNPIITTRPSIMRQEKNERAESRERAKL